MVRRRFPPHLDFFRPLRQRWNFGECCDIEVRPTRRIRHHQRHRLRAGVERTVGLHGSAGGLRDWEDSAASAVQPQEPIQAPRHRHPEACWHCEVLWFHSADLLANERLQQRISAGPAARGDWLGQNGFVWVARQSFAGEIFLIGNVCSQTQIRWSKCTKSHQAESEFAVCR